MRKTSLRVATFLVALSFSIPVARAAAPVHTKTTETFETLDEAGSVCDFTLQAKWSYIENFKDFPDGHSIGSFALTIHYLNVDSGATLTESDRYTYEVNWVTGYSLFRGINSKLRDEDGRIVYVWAGRYAFDVYTGEIFHYTRPLPDFAQTICPLLGGKAVPQ
jgi:hypothetical protein